ncbi:MAG: SurA N-terminal domain-containing protein [Nitrospirota bacterium]|nr:SurA N-terminal domain-containing protein [Nitrospirota bacterium]
MNKSRKAYRYALFLLPAVLLAAAVGYYKYILPEGVAAVVNGERIMLAEVDGFMSVNASGTAMPSEKRIRMRYAALSDLINERIAWQAAKRAGISVSGAEIEAAYDRARSAVGSPDGFDDLISAQYGSRTAFRNALERKIGIRKFISERLAAGTADPTILDGRVNQWLGTEISRASVRIALAEQAPASGCGCCNTGGKGGEGGMTVQMQEAQKAVRAYWQARNGDGPVELRASDFGCHIQVDVMRGEKIAQSFRYQNGTISAL